MGSEKSLVGSIIALGVGLLAACSSEPAPKPAEPTPLVVPPMPTTSATWGSATPAPAEEATEETRNGPVVAARDPRWASRRARSRTAILGEVQNLERLLASTSQTAPDRPELLRRVAEDYVELARTSDGSARSDARKKAIDAYDMIATNHSSYSLLDEVRYYVALEHELSGDARRARSSYYDLIKNHPQSKLIPLAYFAFGEMFFVEAGSDPSKWDLALQAFLEVIKYPATNNAVYPDALLRLAQVEDRKGEPVKATKYRGQLLRDHPQSEAAQQAKR